MTRILTNSDDTTASSGLARRTLLKGAATVAASALLASNADAPRLRRQCRAAALSRS
ncbi:hypothetical protein ACVWWO_008142 [Bradyrhizobium sp. F1.13.1]